ncbi:glycosyltransferase family 4 protein [Pseudomonas sp. GD04087]|uniref:glycosyltransferase family 4 protein n=1 Tax=unclassified Pseudomonas TaxID=196821 RepID=UPI00244957EC|nr:MULTISPECIES: glycosyltransferase family 4 protein [unclassified Pseudomonas]MDH0288654.1 glycosyltransferase family 4 protein [Pseudomonas sp. GD04087]MDH1049867.1 glycosyltransferase family 4 protein [Pseudomonas sp. GD03903]MDH1998134.1 glycosyltransferase family 4 protein [Pseudomonas sp. GD03691]
MRWLLLTQYFWPENFRINELAAELERRGHQVTVLTGVPNYPEGVLYPQYRVSPASWRRMGNVEVIRVPLVPRGQGAFRLMLNYLSFAMAASTLGAWKLRGREFEAILVFQPSPATIGLPSVILRRLKRAPTLFWVQDLWPDTLQAIGIVQSARVLRWMDRLLGWVYARTDLLLAQSQAFVPRLRQQAPEHVPISYLPNWASPSPEALQASPRAPVAERAVFKIYYLGNLGEAQDFPTVLDAMAQLAHRDDLHWCLVGDGRLAGWIAEQLEARALTNRVSLLGAFPPDQMERFYEDADALLVSLKSNPLFALTVPSKVQSYLAAGVPLLAMLDGEGARIVRDAGAGLTCAAGDSAGLVSAVQALMTLPAEQRQLMGQSGREYNRREFDFQQLVDRLEGMIRTVPT